MKVGILTYHKTINYGAIYQTYALQKYLLISGYDTEVIDYVNNTLKNRYDYNPFNSSNFREFIKRILFFYNNYVNVRKFDIFMQKNISLSLVKYNENNISSSSELYDKFIVGSDQVWNLDLSGNDYNYFLDFSKNKEKNNSYAASFGAASIEKKDDNLIRLLQNFNKISVREQDGIDIVSNMLERKDAKLVLDPVFLLSSEQWGEIIPRIVNKKKYIFVYQVALTPFLCEFARKLAAKTGYSIIHVTSSNRKMKGAKNIYTASPQKFLSYLKYSEYVVTSSFHGLALSIILKKQVFFDLDSKKQNFNSRITSLAKILKLEKQMIKEKFEENTFEAIDYENVYKQLEKYVIDSKGFINSIFS